MQNEKLTYFKSLHQAQSTLVLNNIWDAASAKIIEATGAKALATSSASLAWSLGYSDGCYLPRNELIAAVRRIYRCTSLPISVDIENGLSDVPNDVASLVEELLEIGVVGINIEDGKDKPELLTNKIAAIRDKCRNTVFINARTDIYLQSLVPRESALTETISRLKMYKNAGADCVFVPGIEEIQALKTICGKINLPVNIMLSNLNSDLNDYVEAGVKRFSVGPNSFLRCYEELSIKGTSLDYQAMNGLMPQ